MKLRSLGTSSRSVKKSFLLIIGATFEMVSIRASEMCADLPALTLLCAYNKHFLFGLSKLKQDEK